MNFHTPLFFELDRKIVFNYLFCCIKYFVYLDKTTNTKLTLTNMKTNYLKSIVFVLLLFVVGITQGQEKKVSPPSNYEFVQKNAAERSSLMTVELFKEVVHTTSSDKWAISVKPTMSRKHYLPEVIAIKQSKVREKINSIKANEETPVSSSVAPIIGANFEANWSLNSTPPDNSMAISNGGFIVTANNDGVEYYNESGTLLYFEYWSDFFNDNTLTSSLYDPKVIYDSGADRYIMVVLHGSSASTSKVIVCFSKTNDPQNGWWTFKLTGNPLNNDCWFDYPAIGVSNNEVYITGNLFKTNGAFNQAIIYQIQKSAGFTGGSLNWNYWNNLSSTPYNAFTLIPASRGHQGNYGPGIYFVSSSAGGSDKIRLWDLTDDIGGSPQINSYSVNTTAYSPSSDASQSGTSDKLDNGDCRIQNAFYLNGIIHYVFHADIGSGWNGIIYNRLTVSSSTNERSTFGLQGSYDYSYPAVASFSSTAEDKSVTIAFLRSSSQIYPQLRVVNCSNDFNWSSSTLVKEGDTYVDFLSGEERWGDYTGIARRYNASSPRVWLAGSYGANASNKSNTFKTWVAEVTGSSATAIINESINNKSSIYPNPTYDLINITFNVESYEQTTIQILDMNGKVVKLLYSDMPKLGENKLIFNKGVLPVGSYFVNISTATKTLKNEKLIILD